MQGKKILLIAFQGFVIHNYILKYFYSYFFTLIICGCLVAEPLRIATYNIENFYDRNDDPYSTKDSRVDQGTAPKSARALYALAKVIKSVDADIIALQEVENIGFLREFNKSYLKDLGYKNVVLIHNSSFSLKCNIKLCRLEKNVFNSISRSKHFCIFKTRN